MGSDSDDDFERFLQEDDSASMSSASPVKRKVVKNDTKKKASATAKPSSSSGKVFGGSSKSVVAAAEKLLAGSARAKAKKQQQVVQEADYDDEEPPPSYSDDPYAFELVAATSAYTQKSDEDDADSSGYHSSSRRKSKTTKSKKGHEDSSRAPKTKGKSRDKEPPASKPAAKAVRTLEDRVADILKRTGSTAYPAGVVAQEKAVDDDDDDKSEDDFSDSAEAKTETTSKQKEAKAMPRASAATRQVSANADVKASDSDDDSDLHRLSFSDSLGMESADFEVGARGKFERSRLSLSSLNSEKFAVNLDALEESEHVSQNRYDQPNEGFGPSTGASEPADSDYGDDGFELDQTTADVEKSDRDTTDRQSPTGSSFVSQFESMKNLFSLDSPIKSADTVAAIQPEEHRYEFPPVHDAQPPESDNFGYDDEDFETDEIAPPVEQASAIVDDRPETVMADEYGEESFDGGEDLQAADGIVENKLARLDQQEDDLPELKSLHPTEPLPSQSDTPVQFKFEVVSRIVSVTETTTAPPNKIEENRVSTTAPSPPKSPPPPPPPEDEDDRKQTPRTTPQSQTPPLQQQSIPQTASSVNPTISQPRRSVDRLREIEHQVSSLRFMRDQTPPQSADATRVRESQDVHDSTTLVDDPATLAEIDEIQQMMELAKRPRKGRRKSVSTRSSVKENELALRLQQAQRQLLRFKQDVKELAQNNEEEQSPRIEDGVDKLSHASESPTGKEVEPFIRREGESSRRSSEARKVLRKERDELKKEMQSQERLIQGFQRENELLMKQLKQLQRDVHYDVHKENESLRVQLKELRTTLDGTPHRDVVDGIGGKLEYRSAIEARLQAEAFAGSLQDELKEQARRHQDRINEMKIELEKVKKAKIDLEYRCEGINIEKMEAESREIKLLKEQVQTQRAEHDHAVSALQKKIDWYVNNQRLLDEQDDKMNALREENKRLKDELAASGNDKTRGGRSPLPARSPVPPGKGPRLPADIRRIQELESRLSEMEEAMRKRHPDSLVSLIVASRKADDESKLDEMAEEHKRKVAELTEEMERLQMDNEKKLNAFRQQQEKLVRQYQKQIADYERQLANKENGRRGSTTAQAKAKKLTGADEDELYRVRRFYAEKIKEIERKWEAKYRAVKKQHYAASGAFPDNAPLEHSENSPSDTARVIRALQQKIGSQDEEIRRLRAGTTTSGAWEGSDLRRRISNLESQLKTSEDARRHLVETISSLSTMVPAADFRPRQSEQETSRRERERDLETKLIAAKTEHERSIEEHRDQIKSLKQHLADEATARQQLLHQIAGHAKEVDRLQKVFAEAEYEKRRLQRTAEKVPALEREVALLRDQVVSVPTTPSMLQFRSLELRIETLTQKHQLREAELQMLLAQATQSSHLEKLNFERMYQNAIALKNAEIHTFKKQLGAILDELETLRRAAPSKGLQGKE